MTNGGEALDSHNSNLRNQILIPSGGWVGELVILMSDLLGVWDVSVLSVLFILSWVVIRTTYMEISFVLGLVYDLGIPLQYQTHDKNSSTHKVHLERYWPVFVIGTIVEVVMYLLAHPDLFTLTVSLKTLMCTILWMRKRPHGSNVKFASVPKINVPLPRLDALQATRQPRAPSPHPTAPLAPRDSSRTPRAPSPRPNPTPARVERPPARLPKTYLDPRFPDADGKLLRAGYTDPKARQGMIHKLLSLPDDNEARYNMRVWQAPREDSLTASRMAEYRNRYEASLRFR